MKKFLNLPDDAVDEMLAGFLAAHADLVEERGPRVLAARHRRNGVAIVTGGGSGHKPAFIGYLGAGMLDAVAVGDVFTSPPARTIYHAIRAANRGHGVLCLFGNYAGDVMNFRMAAELAARDGIATRLVLATDDLGPGFADQPQQRRGVTGQVLAWKMCGALADQGASLDRLAALAHDINASTRTIGVALSGCTVPAARHPTFVLADDELEMGVGHHGEPGASREPLRPVDEISERMLSTIFSELDPKGEPVAVIVNGLGATPQMELYIAYRKIAELLTHRGVRVHRAWVGEYFTALEMAGLSVTISVLDKERALLLDAPADTVALRVGHLSRTVLDTPSISIHRSPPLGAATAADANFAEPTVPSADRSAADAGVYAALVAVAEHMPDERDDLCRLDAALGDGDHGVSIAKTFRAVARKLPSLASAPAQIVLVETADVIFTEVGGAMGPLFGAAFLAAAEHMPRPGDPRRGAQIVADTLDAAAEAIRTRGGATTGDKTMLDAVEPAAEAARRAAESTGSARIALRSAAEAAREGAARTAEMVARVGRASRLGSRTLGHPDPGATSVALMLQYAVNGLESLDRNTPPPTRERAQ